jgi:hypothetical protein
MGFFLRLSSSNLPEGGFSKLLIYKLIRIRGGEIETPKNLRMAKPCADPDQK